MLFLFVLFLIASYDPVVNENAKLKLALAIHTGAPRTLTNHAIETPPLVANKQLRIYQKIVKGSDTFTKPFTH